MIFCWEGGSYKKLAPFGWNAYHGAHTAPTCRERSYFVRFRPKAKGAGTKTTSNPRRRYRAERDGTNIRNQDRRTKLDFPRADFYLIYFGSYSSRPDVMLCWIHHGTLLYLIVIEINKEDLMESHPEHIQFPKTT